MSTGDDPCGFEYDGVEYDTQEEMEEAMIEAETSTRATRAELTVVPDVDDDANDWDDALVSDAPRWEWRGVDDLFAPLPKRNWLVEGLWPDLSYGAMAGEKKTFKSYNALLLAVAVAAGVDYLGRFKVTRAPVVYMAAEGGSDQFQLRFQEVCNGYGIRSPEQRAELRGHFHVTHNRAPINTIEFRENVTAKLDEHKPGLLIVDSLYNVHAEGVETSNLYQRGKMLSDLSELVRDKCALIIVDHFKKSTGSLDLHNISMAGVGEWVDSWVLQRHRKPFDKNNKRAALEVEFGNRYGGREYALDITAPPHPDEAGHVGAVTWELRDLDEAEAADRADKGEDTGARIAREIKAALSGFPEGAPDGLTAGEIEDHDEITGNRQTIRAILNSLVRLDVAQVRKTKVERLNKSGRPYSVEVYQLRERPKKYTIKANQRESAESENDQ
ncbi:AAA family ATPase [Gordonia sp. NPDC003504]